MISSTTDAALSTIVSASMSAQVTNMRIASGSGKFLTVDSLFKIGNEILRVGGFVRAEAAAGVVMGRLSIFYKSG